MKQGRIIGGIPEEDLLRRYVGKHSESFFVDLVNTFSPHSGSNTDIIVLRWLMTDSNRISVHYTASRQAIMVTHKTKWTVGSSDIWDQTHNRLFKLHDPNGEQSVETFITDLVQDHKDGRNKCCATRKL